MSTTQTYDFTGSVQTLDVSDVDLIHADLLGAGGEDGEEEWHGEDPDSTPGVGGAGGRAEGYVDVSGFSTLYIYVGGGNGNTWGRSNGGSGGQDGSHAKGGNGGGSTEVWGDDTTFLLAADAGGGGGSTGYYANDMAGGGGGARGGAGGVGRLDTNDGEDAEGSGFGGDGGDEQQDGDPGGAEVDSTYVHDATTETGTGNDGNATATVTAYKIDDLTVAAERETEIDLAWTSEDDLDGQRLYRSTDPGVDPGTATLLADLDPTVESYTDTDLDNGTDYYYLIEAYVTDSDGDATTESNEASGQTVLPDVEGFVLDASEREQLRVDLNDILNAGWYRIRWKRSDNADYDPADEATVAYDTDPLEYIIEPVLGGEQYDVGVRTETDDATGAWHTASEITKLVGAEDITFSGVGQTTIDSVSWSIGTEFDGSHQIWWRRDDYEYDDPKGELIATVADTATSFSNFPEVYPDRDYTVTIRAVTQYVYADGPKSTTTDSAGLAQHPAPPRGWYAEVDHPSGRTRTPQLLDDAQIRPRVNDLPETRLPVPRDEQWFSGALEGAPTRVWKDAERRPVDEIESASLEAGRGELVGVGGTQLERRVQEDVVAEPAHDLAERLIAEHTDYQPVVDAPVSTESTAIAQDPDSVADWESVTEFTDFSELPFKIFDDGRFGVVRSNLLWGTTDSDLIDGNTGVPASDDDFAGGEAAEYDEEGDYTVSAPIDLNYRIPEDHLEIGARLRSDSGAPRVRAHLIDDDDGSEVGRIELWDGVSTNLNWFGTDEDVFSIDLSGSWDAGGIEPGSYRLRIEAPFAGSTSGAATAVDLVSFHDSRYDYQWPDSTDSEDGIAGPEPHPNASIVLDAYRAVLSVRGGDITLNIDDTSGEQFVGLSNDGANFNYAHNTDTHSAEFSDLGGELFVELGLGRYGDAGAGAVPRYGVEGQSVDSYTLEALLDDTPIILNRQLDGDLKDVLASIAEDSDSLYEVRQDGDQTEVHWAQPGQRTSADAPEVAEYTVTKESNRILKATVKGGRAGVEDEHIVADLSSSVDLAERNVIAGTERVRSASDGTQYRANLDYQLRTGAGELDIRDSGAIADGEELVIDYEYNVSGSYEHEDFDGDPQTEIVEEIPQATSERACAQAARVLVDELSEARYEADVTIPPGEDISGLLEALDLDKMPGDAMSVYEVEETPQGLQLRLGSRDRKRDTVQRIQAQLTATSERV